jgi:hypothetical protein
VIMLCDVLDHYHSDVVNPPTYSCSVRKSSRAADLLLLKSKLQQIQVMAKEMTSADPICFIVGKGRVPL